MRRFRLKFFDPDVMDWRYLHPMGRRGSTAESWKAGQYTMAELEYAARPDSLATHRVHGAILAAIESGHLTKEYV